MPMMTEAEIRKNRAATKDAMDIIAKAVDSGNVPEDELPELREVLIEMRSAVQTMDAILGDTPDGDHLQESFGAFAAEMRELKNRRKEG